MRLADVSHALRVRLTLSFVERVLEYAIVPVMAIYLAHHFGAASSGGVLLVSVAAAVAAALGGGQMCDRVGRRVTLIAGAGAMALAYLVMAVCAGGEIPAGVAAGFLLLSASAGLSRPAHDAMLIDASTADQRTGVYALDYWALNLAIALGAVIGTFGYQRFFSVILAGAMAAAVGVTIATAALLPETVPAKAPDAALEHGRIPWRGLAGGYGAVLRDSRFLRLIIAMTLLSGVEMQITGYLAVRIDAEVATQTLLSVGAWQFAVGGVELVGLIRAINTVLVVAAGLAVAKWLSRMQRSTAMFTGIALIVAGFTALAVSGHAGILLAAAVVFTVGELMWVPSVQTVMAELVPAARRATYLAIAGLRPRIAMALASLTLMAGAFVPGLVIAGSYLATGAVVAILCWSVLGAVPQPVTVPTTRSS